MSYIHICPKCGSFIDSEDYENSLSTCEICGIKREKTNITSEMLSRLSDDESEKLLCLEFEKLNKEYIENPLADKIEKRHEAIDRYNEYCDDNPFDDGKAQKNSGCLSMIFGALLCISALFFSASVPLLLFGVIVFFVGVLILNSSFRDVDIKKAEDVFYSEITDCVKNEYEQIREFLNMPKKTETIYSGAYSFHCWRNNDILYVFSKWDTVEELGVRNTFCPATRIDYDYIDFDEYITTKIIPIENIEYFRTEEGTTTLYYRLTKNDDQITEWELTICHYEIQKLIPEKEYSKVVVIEEKLKAPPTIDERINDIENLVETGVLSEDEFQNIKEELLKKK